MTMLEDCVQCKMGKMDAGKHTELERIASFHGDRKSGKYATRSGIRLEQTAPYVHER